MNRALEGEIELSQSRDRRGENFPVGSRLLPARLRPAVHAFYAFARAADDVADSAELAAPDKLARLDRMERALTTGDRNEGAEKAATLHETLAGMDLPPDHALALLSAFRQDVTKNRYASWRELMGYCALSAHPVGRFLLDLHGEAVEKTGPPADALCAALQVLNHLQDLGEDRAALDRVYLPQDWMAEAGASEQDLAAPRVSPALREVIDRCLDGVDALLDEARTLPRMIENPRLAAEVGAIHSLARALSRRLRRCDPLSQRVGAARLIFVALAATGAAETLLTRLARRAGTSLNTHARPEPRQDGPLAQSRARAREVVSRAGSSFTLGMRVLPRPRREAMYAIYAFCREVDDIADGDRLGVNDTVEGRRKALSDWRWEIDRIYDGAPTHPLGPALAAAAWQFGLPKAEFLRILQGMRMDLDGAAMAPEEAALAEYCRCVAGAVGMLSIRTFGAGEPQAAELAVVLGEALQLTNILRDLDEDAALGRLYLPRELLLAHGIPHDDPAAALDHPAIGEACTDLAMRAEMRFAEARALIARCDRRRLLPSIVMLDAYQALLRRLLERGWRAPRRPIRLSTGQRLRLLLRFCPALIWARLLPEREAAR